MNITASKLIFASIFSCVALASQSMSVNSNSQFQCGYISCLDECTGSYLSLYGDTCTNQWDALRQCWTAYAQCNSQPPPNCGTIACYDACTSMTNVFNGNSCVNVWDDVRGCYTARGECR